MALAAAWPDEPVVVQEFTAEQRLGPQTVGDRRPGLRRPAPLRTGGCRPDPAPTLPLALGDLPAGWLDLARRVGEVFALDVYGVDVIDTGDGAPLIVDINAFPGVRGQAGAPEALAALALRAAGRARTACGPPRQAQPCTRRSR